MGSWLLSKTSHEKPSTLNHRKPAAADEMLKPACSGRSNPYWCLGCRPLGWRGCQSHATQAASPETPSAAWWAPRVTPDGRLLTPLPLHRPQHGQFCTIPCRQRTQKAQALWVRPHSAAAGDEHKSTKCSVSYTGYWLELAVCEVTELANCEIQRPKELTECIFQAELDGFRMLRWPPPGLAQFVSKL